MYECLYIPIGFSHYHSSSTPSEEETPLMLGEREHHRKLIEQTFQMHWSGTLARIVRSSFSGTELYCLLHIL